MRIILIGGPGSGKGTQAQLLCDKFKLKHISTGNIIRKSASIGLEKNYDVCSGKFIDDFTMNSIVSSFYNDKLLNENYILDGYPRNINQAEFFINNIVGSDIDKYVFIHLKADPNILYERTKHRTTCLNCGETYNILYNPPKVSLICDKCGSQLSSRKDDDIEVFKFRVSIFEEQTKPMIEYFLKMYLLFEVNAILDIQNVHKSICNILGRKYDLHKK